LVIYFRQLNKNMIYKLLTWSLISWVAINIYSFVHIGHNFSLHDISLTYVRNHKSA
jgi:hypothetical protein